MCGGSGRLNLKTKAPTSSDVSENLNPDMDSKYSFSRSLEFAADNDVEGFKQLAPSTMDEIGVWYSRQKDSKRMVLEHRTPLMIAARYGSTDVVKLITSLPGIDVDQICEPEKSTALHCAASGGSTKAAEVTMSLLLAGADPSTIDAHGKRPFDVIAAHHSFPDLKVKLQVLLSLNEDVQLSSSLDSPFSDISKEKKDYYYPVDASFPDIKSSMYSTDEFRMYAFKILPCSRAYSHDWTECPFVHPGENAKRRDPRKFRYSCVQCPEFRKGFCKHGDLCEFAHGVFESWLHPAQYRTIICKDGTSCNRRVCFFAHRNDELRPTLYIPPTSTNSHLSASAMDMPAVLNMLPGSPSSMPPVMSPSPFSPPNGNGVQHSHMATLHPPGSSSRLRSALNARDLANHFHEPHMMNNCFKTTLPPSNLEELFSAEMSSPSPRCYDKHASASLPFSPTHRSLLLNQLQQNMLSSMNVPMGVSSPRGMSPIGSSNQYWGNGIRGTIGSPKNHRASWESVGGSSLDWSVQSEKLIQHPKSGSEMHKGGGEVPPNFSWAHNLVKESSPTIKTSPIEGSNFNSNTRSESNNQAMISAWLQQMQLDPVVSK